MDNFKYWLRTHGNEITWFVIGSMATAGLFALLAGNFISALIYFGIAYLNYAMNS